MSRIFHPCIFDRPVFSCLAYSVAPFEIAAPLARLRFGPQADHARVINAFIVLHSMAAFSMKSAMTTFPEVVFGNGRQVTVVDVVRCC